MSRFSSSEEDRIKQNIVGACMGHYGVFGQSHAANLEASRQLSSASECDKRFSSSLSKLYQLSNSLIEESSSWRKKRQLATQAAANSSRTVELLEAPQTLESCLKSESYHYAILVIDHISTLRKENPDSRIIQSVHDSVEYVLAESLEKIVIPRLSQPMDLTIAIKLLTFFRRMGFEDGELKALFLARKGLLVDNALNECTLKSTSSNSSLCKMISAFKMHMSESVVHYEACFIGNQEGNTNTIPSGGTLVTTSSSADVSVNSGATCPILSAWVKARCDIFLPLFQRLIIGITRGAELVSLMSQITPLTSALCRAFCDITGKLTSLIESRAVELFRIQINGAITSYRIAMETSTWKSPYSKNSSISKVLGGKDASSDCSAPLSLMHYLPLAYAVNGILSACNEIRKCAFSIIAIPCVAIVVDFVSEMSMDARRARLGAEVDPQEEAAVKDYIVSFQSVFVPFVVQVLGKLFPNLPKESVVFDGLHQHM
eukprot:Tbor_TRINITY_DN2992_c0_g1::TRINITY_DN2992_c0_g1_i1::g.1051::m.1051/K20295/COG8; conserved oligomeric Golgi complex subunit 8